MGRRVLRQSSGKSYGTLATPDSFPDDTTSSSSSSDESNTSSPKSSRPPRSSKIRKDRKRPIVRTSLAFGSPEDDPRTEAQYAQARTLPYGDYNYPVVHEDERFRYPPNIQAEIDRQARDYLSRSQARILSHQSSAASIGSAGVNTSTRNSSPDLTFEPA
ncbi:hypothetical protein DFJ77DRAFT_469439 [Powellomyces hirtus]|nr:hypothetical protein DFJ77DRAFT_469439 [Powellomyces hirtus]